jgi:hypothetical protein
MHAATKPPPSTIDAKTSAVSQKKKANDGGFYQRSKYAIACGFLIRNIDIRCLLKLSLHCAARSFKHFPDEMRVAESSKMVNGSN